METISTEKTVGEILFFELPTVRLPERPALAHKTFLYLFDALLRLKAEWPTEALVETVEYFIKNAECEVIQENIVSLG
jgi:hypothetical protein